MGLLNRVIGHNRQKQILISSLRRNRIATTYLFSGRRGIGKKLTAIEFAKAINCLSPIEGENSFDSCDRCVSCKKFFSYSHPDFRVIEPVNGIIRIDTIRKVQEFLSFAPYEGIKKAIIIDDADSMNQAASSAFLKTLEEPPPNSLIVLVAMSPDVLLDTVKSRCFWVRFSPLKKDETFRIIKKQLSDVDRETIEYISRFSMGSPGESLKLDISTSGEILRSFAGIISQGSEPIQWRDRIEMEDWFQHYLIMLRDILVLKVHPGEKELLINKRIEEDLSAAYKKLDIKDIIKLYNDALLIIKHFKFNLNTSIISNLMKTSIN